MTAYPNPQIALTLEEQPDLTSPQVGAEFTRWCAVSITIS